METVCQGRGAYMEVSQADLRETGAAGFETEGLIDFLRDMEGVEPVSYTHLDVYKRQESIPGPGNL